MDISGLNTDISISYQQEENTPQRQTYLLRNDEGDVFVNHSAKKSERKSFFRNIVDTVRNLCSRHREEEPPVVVNIEPVFETYSPFEFEEVEKEKPDTEMARFLESPDYEKKIKQATEGKYQKNLLKILSSKTMDDKTKRRLMETKLTEEEFLSGVKKLSTSTFKAALNKPSQYINYTQDPMYQSFFIDSIDKMGKNLDMEKVAAGFMEHFFNEYMAEILNALQYVDTDTLNQMMDKRSTSFSIMLKSLNELTPENGTLLKELISHTRKGDASEKIKLCQIVEIFQSNEFDMNILKHLNEKGEIDESALKEVFKKAALKMAGVEQEDEKTRTDFNEEYFHLLFSRIPVMSKGAPAWGNDFENLLRAAIEGDFEGYISNEGNRYGKANKNTEKAFIENGLDYESWLHPDIEPEEFNLSGKKMTLKMWDRDPFEDLFLGNKTRCCTAIRTGANSAAMPLFILNTSFNVVEMLDNKGNVKGMARIYMTKAEDKPSVVIDSIELTDIKQLSDEEKLESAENIFNYVKKFGEIIAKKPVDVYYISEDSKIPLHNKKESKFFGTEFIGDISTDKIYTNNNSSGRWGDLRGKTHAHYYRAA